MMSPDTSHNNDGVCQLEPITFHGWSAWRLANNQVSMVAVPELGGRVMSLKLAEHEFLFMNSALAGKRFTSEEHAGDGSLLNWKNYGGEKTWPAPQGWERPDQWPGPPDPMLDSGVYSAEPVYAADASVSLTMRSPPDARSGLRITRRLTLAPETTRVQLELSFQNIADHPVRWAIWDVMQINCAAPDGTLNDQMWVYVPTHADPLYTILYGDPNPQWQPEIVPGVLGVQYRGHVGKIGVANQAGWVAVVDQAAQHALAIRFHYEPGAEYPDGGASVECWTESPGAPSPVPIQSPGFLLEAEVLGALHTLQPAEHSHLALEWLLAQGRGHVSQVTDAGFDFRSFNHQ